MSAVPSPNYSDAQRREAAEWFVEIHARTEPDVDALQAWLRWMESADGNRVAFEAVVAAWYAAPKPLMVPLPSAEELEADSYDGSVPLTRWKAVTPVPNVSNGAAATRCQAPPRRRTRRYWAMGIAAGLAAFVVGTLALRGSLSPEGREYITKTGERLEISLPEGSHISLGGKSRLYVAFTKARRNVNLEAGEAYFTVAKDPARPFVVHALNTDVIAVGTAFDVRDVADQVTVSVSEGVVKVRPPTATRPIHPDPDVRVAAGEQVAVNEAGEALTVSQIPGARMGHADWRSGLLVYRNESLRAVVADISRYTNLRIVVAPGATGDLRFSGAVHSDAIVEWAEALPESFPVRLVRSSDRITIIGQ